MEHATREYCPVMNDLAVYERQVAIDEIHAEQVQEKFDDLIDGDYLPAGKRCRSNRREHG